MSISVVIPAYNASRFIAATLESVLSQSLPADEILVVDDGSTDDTAAIAENFGPPVRVFRRPNSRQGASRNFGAQQAAGEWIAFIDADDLWEPNKLERQMEELSKHPDADICYTARVRFTQEEDAIRIIPTPSYDIPFAPAQKIREGLFRCVTFLPSSAVIRRSAFLAAGGFNDQRTSEDWDLWLRLLHRGTKFASCSEPLLLYRLHGNNVTVTSNKLTIYQENMSVYRAHVVPHLTGPRRWIAPARYFSPLNADIAYLLREKGDPRCLSVMTASILQWPFGDLTRYKGWLHMLLTRLNVIAKRARK